MATLGATNSVPLNTLAPKPTTAPALFADLAEPKSKSIFSGIDNSVLTSVLSPKEQKTEVKAKPEAASKKEEKPKTEATPKATDEAKATTPEKPKVQMKDLDTEKETKGVKSAKLEGQVLHLTTDRGSFSVPIGCDDKSKIKIENNPNGMGYIVKVKTGENSWNEVSLAQAHEITTKKGSNFLGFFQQEDVKQDNISNIVNFKAKTLDENGEEQTTTSSRSMHDDKGKSLGVLNNINAVDANKADGTTISYLRNDEQRTFIDRAGQFALGSGEATAGVLTTAFGSVAMLAGGTIASTGAGIVPGVGLAAAGVGITTGGASMTGDGLGRMFSSFQDDGGKHNVTVSTGGNTKQYSDDNMVNIQNKINSDLNIKPIDLNNINPLSLLNSDPYYSFTQNFTQGIDKDNYNLANLKYNEEPPNYFADLNS